MSEGYEPLAVALQNLEELKDWDFMCDLEIAGSDELLQLIDGAIDAIKEHKCETSIQIDTLVDRFLRWRLPADFSPDAGIEFKKPSELFPEMENADEVHWPIGTNLLDATEAKAMLEYVFSKDVEEVNLNG